MKIKIDFFSNDVVGSLTAGIYIISVKKNNKEKELYIGESKVIMIRCAQHLWELKKEPAYFGFDDELINDDKIQLIFRRKEDIGDMGERRRKEKQLIKDKQPLSQSGVSDRLIDVVERKKRLLDFIKSTEG